MESKKKKNKKGILISVYISCHIYFSVSVPNASNAELVMLTVSDIVRQLIIAHKEKRDVNLNK